MRRQSAPRRSLELGKARGDGCRRASQPVGVNAVAPHRQTPPKAASSPLWERAPAGAPLRTRPTPQQGARPAAQGRLSTGGRQDLTRTCAGERAADRGKASRTHHGRCVERKIFHCPGAMRHKVRISREFTQPALVPPGASRCVLHDDAAKLRTRVQSTRATSGCYGERRRAKSRSCTRASRVRVLPRSAAGARRRRLGCLAAGFAALSSALTRRARQAILRGDFNEEDTIYVDVATDAPPRLVLSKKPSGGDGSGGKAAKAAPAGASS